VPRILIVYASTHGHTAKVASRLARTLEEDGCAVDVRDIGLAGDVKPADHDAVVVGASVHGGRHQREAVEWTRHHAMGLNGMPSAFFSVCLAAADDTEESREAVRGYVDDLLDDTGWMPRLTTTFAGALQYREYDFMTRLAMRVLMRHGDHPTDVSRDYDYTDWDAVERFAHEVTGIAAGRS
jgi:menaquinone-dependent protoporphyrinogen oxidase